jgi:hypothetical protein
MPTTRNHFLASFSKNLQMATIANVSRSQYSFKSRAVASLSAWLVCGEVILSQLWDGERPAGRLRMVTPGYFVLRFDRHTVHTHQAPFTPSGGDELLKRLKICHYH